MQTPDHPAVIEVEHYVAKTVSSLPPRLLRIIGRGVAEPEGRAPAPDVAALLAISRLTGERVLGDGDDPVRRRAATRRGALTAAPRRPDPTRVEETTVAGAAGPLRARLYIPPKDTSGRLLVFYHGGGWVTGDLDTHDAPCRLLARQAATRVLAVDYRLAPEHPFPAPVEDALAAFADVVGRAAELGAAPDRIAVGGDSAGGNLAAVVAQQTAGGVRPAAALLIYPACDLTGGTASRDLFARGFLLEKPDMDWCQERYLQDAGDPRDPRVSPAFGTIDAAHPPTVVVTAGFDPLRDEGEAYAAQLREAGVPTVLRGYEGLVHGFANVTAISPTSHDAMVDCASALLAAQELAPAARIAVNS
jgi:acetyl esterase